MKSVAIEHIEEFNKTINVEAFAKEVSNCKNTKDDDEINKAIVRAIVKSADISKSQKAKMSQEGFYESFKAKYGTNQLTSMFFTCNQIHKWLVHKQIYKFDKDTLELMLEQEFRDMSYEEFEKMKFPYTCFAIENEIAFDNKVFDTWLWSVSKLSTGALVFEINAFVKGASEQYLGKVILKNGVSFCEALTNYKADERELLLGITNLVLYISQPKVEILKKKVDNGQKGSKLPKSMYSLNYEENEIGYKLGNAIRKYKIVYEKGQAPSTPSGRKAVKPHSRCGHFHHYWVGKGRTQSIVKYVEPTFVLGGNKKATVHKVKGD